MPQYDELRTTITQALARTMVDESRRSGSGSGPVPAEDDDGSPGPPPVLPGVGDLVDGHYRLVRVLGEGMFGKVYVAQRIDVPEHQVALKLLPRTLYAGRNIERELVMLATVGHPHVVSLKDHGTADDYVWLTMPVYQGETLAARLERGTMGLREAHDVFLAIGRGLEALHQAGLRHQDIKPENIYLAVFAGRIHPILLDLGVAAEKEATFVAGTALYASPEQLLAFTGVPGAVPLTERMDTYCLATTLLMALVGPSRFPGDGAKSRDEVAEAHEVRAKQPLAEDALPELVGPPRQLVAEAFGRWMALDPTERPSMAEMCEQLDVLLEPEREAAAVEVRRLERQKTSLGRMRFGAVLMLLAGLGVIGWGYSKRETLRLAGELDRVRRQGAESFDKLDTCIASHRIARSDAAACKEAREKDQADCRATLDAIAKSGSGVEAERAQKLAQLQSVAVGRLKACEDDASEAARTAQAERERAAKERAQLVAERDEQKALADKLAPMSSELDQCIAQRSACIQERDESRADPYEGRAPGRTPAPAMPATPATPTATPAVPSPAPTGQPAPPPTQAPAPPGPPPATPTASPNVAPPP